MRLYYRLDAVWLKNLHKMVSDRFLSPRQINSDIVLRGWIRENFFSLQLLEMKAPFIEGYRSTSKLLMEQRGLLLIF
jgi:hypothetical protein